jgi:hypothetical protein
MWSGKVFQLTVHPEGIVGFHSGQEFRSGGSLLKVGFPHKENHL